MRAFIILVCLAIVVTLAPLASAQNPSQAAPQSQGTPAINQKAETELQTAVTAANNDHAALVRNLQDYLRRFPDAPQKTDVYRTLVSACREIRDDACVLDYAERLIDIQPDDSQILMIAVEVLEKRGDDASLTCANTYVTHVIDHTLNTYSYQRPERLSLEEWHDRRIQLLLSLHLVRGDIQKSLRHYDAAAQDYQSSFSTHANPAAAEGLGDIAVVHNDPNTAVQQFLLAFVLPDVGLRKVDRRQVRSKLGNVWQQIHSSQQGLGEEILAAYDRNAPEHANPASNGRNKDAKAVFDFVLRRLDGTPFPLAPLKGKVIVLSFWATWCAPCRELEPLLVQVAKQYADNPGVAFLAVNTDEDESQIPAYIAEVKWDLPLVYSDGLGKFLGVIALPNVIILDRDAKIVYSAAGLPEKGFTESIQNALHVAMAPSSR
jgi:thiol-disulfide isomerase/thioredoxin